MLPTQTAAAMEKVKAEPQPALTFQQELTQKEPPSDEAPKDPPKVAHADRQLRLLLDVAAAHREREPDRRGR